MGKDEATGSHADVIVLDRNTEWISRTGIWSACRNRELVLL